MDKLDVLFRQIMTRLYKIINKLNQFETYVDNKDEANTYRDLNKITLKIFL